MANTLQKAASTVAARNSGGKTIKDYVNQMEGEIAKALPSVITPERFTRIVLSAISNNPKLAQCTSKSFLGAMMQAAQLGLEPNTPLGQAYLIPYRNKGILECQFQIGYKGLIDLAHRSGEVSVIMAQIVYENDEFDYSFGLEPKLDHKPAKGDRGKPVFVYAMYRTKDGGYGYEVWSMEDVRKHAQQYSKAVNDGPWKTNFNSMAKKTVLKQVLKYAPLKSDFARAVSQDETIKQVSASEPVPDMSEVADVTVYEDGTVEYAEDAPAADPEPAAETNA